MVIDDTRYARADGLQRFVEREDARLDHEERERLARADRFDKLYRRIKHRAAGTWLFEELLLLSCAAVAWDEARRLSDRPDLCVSSQRARDGFPFGSPTSALRFFWTTTLGPLGMGASIDVPQDGDRKEDLALRRLFRSCGIETTAVHASRVIANHDPKGLRHRHLFWDVRSAVHAASSGLHERALNWMFETTIGLEKRVPKSQRMGAQGRLSHRVNPQFQSVPQKIEDTTEHGTKIPGIASRYDERPQVVRVQLRMFRERFAVELVARELMAERPKLHPRRSPPLRAVHRAPTFATWES